MGTAIITGGSRGLGLALSRALIASGWRVVVDARDRAGLASVAVTLGEQFVVVAGDICDARHRRALVEAAGAAVDLVVNNASTLGPLPMQRLSDLAPADFAQVLETNVVAPLALMQEALQRMGPGGAVINVTSDAAVEAYEGWGAYGGSKAALEQISSIFAVEHPELRVWWVDPGDMRTQMHQDAFPGEDISDRPLPEAVVPALLRLVHQRPPSGRLRAADLAGVVA